jgi:hypothetical protein
MRYIKTYEEIKTINYILNVNEDLINEGLIDRLKKMATKGLITATVMASLMSNPAFAKEYKKMDSIDKNKIEKLIKQDTSNKDTSAFMFDGTGGNPVDTLAIDVTNSFGSGKYILSASEKDDMILKLKDIEDYIKTNGGSSFVLTIVSSESQVDMIDPETGKPMEDLELAKLRGNSTYDAIKDYLNNLGVMFKIKYDFKRGDVKYIKSEIKTMGRVAAINQEKYKKDQFVRIVISKGNFKSACSLSDSQSGVTRSQSDDYKADNEYDVTGQLGNVEYELEPGGVPDRAQLFIDNQLVDDTGYFAVGVSSADNSRDNYNYIPKYIYELTMIRNQKGSLAVDDTKFANIDVVHFSKFEDLVKYILVNPNYDWSGSGPETGDYMSRLKDIFNVVKGDFVFYKKVTTPPKLKFKLDGTQGKLRVRVYSPLGQTRYKWGGQCK